MTDRALSPEEQAIIDFVESDKGRRLNEYEINLVLDQARAVGELMPEFDLKRVERI
jgi:hypothetical protein